MKPAEFLYDNAQVNTSLAASEDRLHRAERVIEAILDQAVACGKTEAFVGNALQSLTLEEKFELKDRCGRLGYILSNRGEEAHISFAPPLPEDTNIEKTRSLLQSMIDSGELVVLRLF